MSLWQILGITIAAGSLSIGIFCAISVGIIALVAPEGFEDEDGFHYGKLPDNLPDRARAVLPPRAARVPDVRSHVVGDDTYPASLLSNPFHVSGGMR